jgi:hypothetical protein
MHGVRGSGFGPYLLMFDYSTELPYDVPQGLTS